MALTLELNVMLRVQIFFVSVWFVLGVSSCNPQKEELTESEISKVRSFLVTMDFDSFLTTKDPNLWKEYEFWIEEFGRKKFIRALGYIDDARIQDEIVFLKRSLNGAPPGSVKESCGSAVNGDRSKIVK